MAAVVLLATLAPVTASAGPRVTAIRCRDGADAAHRLTLRVEDEPATGHYAVPDGRAAGLVVFAHGIGHTSFSWIPHLENAARHDLIAVAMDYRGLEILPDENGDGLPESEGWPAIDGAEDLVAAAQAFDRRCRVPQIALVGWSMGGNQSGLAVAMVGEEGITRSDGSPLFDFWIDSEGAVNFTETYVEARAAEGANDTAAEARTWMEDETGCPIEACPREYLRRTVPARIDDVAGAGLDAAIVVHALDDGLVPYNQGREMATLMAAVGIPTEMITVGLRDADSERETTLTGHAAGRVPGYTSPLAGHGSEKSTTHIMMNTTLERLWDLMDGQRPTRYRECVSTGTASGDPSPTVACST
ncbi:MAG TPA: alpha/beta fold hydrolase [Actinomycetota bacterium]|nr:alpha/beta fold hydrolase [Actinomycetota bacterium]